MFKNVQTFFQLLRWIAYEQLCHDHLGDFYFRMYLFLGEREVRYRRNLVHSDFICKQSRFIWFMATALMLTGKIQPVFCKDWDPV